MQGDWSKAVLTLQERTWRESIARGRCWNHNPETKIRQRRHLSEFRGGGANRTPLWLASLCINQQALRGKERCPG